jgi:hypothetical protein
LEIIAKKVLFVEAPVSNRQVKGRKTYRKTDVKLRAVLGLNKEIPIQAPVLDCL